MFKNFFVGAFITTFFAFAINPSVRASDFVDYVVAAEVHLISRDFSPEYRSIIETTFDKLSEDRKELKKQIALLKPWKALYDEKNQSKAHKKIFNLGIEDQLEHHLSIARLRIEKEYRKFKDCSDNYLNQEFVSEQAKLVSMKDECDFLQLFIFENKAINQKGIDFLDSIVARYIDQLA